MFASNRQHLFSRSSFIATVQIATTEMPRNIYVDPKMFEAASCARWWVIRLELVCIQSTNTVEIASTRDDLSRHPGRLFRCTSPVTY